MIAGRYNVTAKVLITKKATPSPTAIDDYVVIAETKKTVYQFSSAIKSLTMNFEPSELLTNVESGNITVSVKLPHDDAVKSNVSLKYAVTKSLQGKIPNASNSEVTEASDTVECTVTSGVATLALGKGANKFHFFPGAYNV